MKTQNFKRSGSLSHFILALLVPISGLISGLALSPAQAEEKAGDPKPNCVSEAVTFPIPLTLTRQISALTEKLDLQPRVVYRFTLQEFAPKPDTKKPAALTVLDLREAVGLRPAPKPRMDFFKSFSVFAEKLGDRLSLFGERAGTIRLTGGGRAKLDFAKGSLRYQAGNQRGHWTLWASPTNGRAGAFYEVRF